MCAEIIKPPARVVRSLPTAQEGSSLRLAGRINLPRCGGGGSKLSERPRTEALGLVGLTCDGRYRYIALILPQLPTLVGVP